MVRRKRRTVLDRIITKEVEKATKQLNELSIRINPLDPRHLDEHGFLRTGTIFGDFIRGSVDPVQTGERINCLLTDLIEILVLNENN